MKSGNMVDFCGGDLCFVCFFRYATRGITHEDLVGAISNRPYCVQLLGRYEQIRAEAAFLIAWHYAYLRREAHSMRIFQKNLSALQPLRCIFPYTYIGW